MNSLYIGLLFMFLAGAVCVAQQPFLGLRAGISTKPEVERVLGRPVKQVSPTLVEYAPKQIKLKAENRSISSGKIYVQYRDASAAAVVERIELIVCARTPKVNDRCEIVVALHDEFDPATAPFSGGTLDARTAFDEKDGFRIFWYFGTPRYMVRTDIHGIGTELTGEVRWAFYSQELYRSAAPTGNCLGSFWGEWETDRGKMTITRTGVGEFRAVYAENGGTVTGTIEAGLRGEWKDSTGSGPMHMLMAGSDGKRFIGGWSRTTGNGPKTGQWEGRCVEE